MMDMEKLKEDSDRRMDSLKQLSERMWTQFYGCYADKNIKVKSNE